jgi:carboxyl-terminal processing protease
MRFRGSIFFSIVLVGVLLLAFYNPVDESEKEAVLMQSILNWMDRFHFSPKQVDDQFSQQAYDLYLDRLDPGRRWLTQEDLDRLQSHKLKLDDEALAGQYPFFDLSIEMLKAGIQKSGAYYKEMLAQPFDFSKDETILFQGDEKPFAKNDAELKEYWRKMMKYETMTRLEDKLEAQEKGEDEELNGKSFDELEADARQEVMDVFDRWYNRLAKEDRADYLSVYLNVFTNIFDPHSGYFEPIEKENFDIGMAGKLEGIGARLQGDGEYVKVTSIVVGGPAWKQGDLEENDKISKVAQGEGGEWTDVTGWQLDDVVQLIRGKKGTTVRLGVKKVDGTMEEITIIRDVVILEESFAKSLLLHTDAKEKVGYIRLPRFYDDFSDANGRSCAEDVAKEIEKLKKENVKGLVLDLRNNPGGSLRDVITMSGLFIEKGPVVQVKSRGRKAEVYNDTDPQVQWDGPLVVMVNNFSASASEILAAALQDYDRALIVGSKSTFGKGSVQRFFDLDRFTMNNDVKPLGAIKLTIQKYYRVDGGSVQLKGVEPDVILPDNYVYIETGEKEQEYPLEWTEIAPADYASSGYLSGKEKAKLQQASMKRLKENGVFNQIEKNAVELKDRRENNEFPLELDAFRNEQNEWAARGDAFDALFENEVVFGVSNPKVDVEGIESNESKKARNDKWLADMKKDVYLEETLNIMRDLLQMKK